MGGKIDIYHFLRATYVKEKSKYEYAAKNSVRIASPGIKTTMVIAIPIQATVKITSFKPSFLSSKRERIDFCISF